MRGFDYRAKTGILAIMITKSFVHDCEAIQGLNRVGSFGDQCKRIMLASVPLSDGNNLLIIDATSMSSSLSSKFSGLRRRRKEKRRRLRRKKKRNIKLFRLNWPRSRS
jgi:hypothetical protein